MSKVIAARHAPYLPTARKVPDALWLQLRPTQAVLMRHGIITGLPHPKLRIGGLITEITEGLGWLVASQHFPVKGLTETLVVCTCPYGPHTVLAEELEDGKCTDHDAVADCGGAT